jgi:hypothetical protein
MQVLKPPRHITDTFSPRLEPGTSYMVGRPTPHLVGVRIHALYGFKSWYKHVIIDRMIIPHLLV